MFAITDENSKQLTKACKTRTDAWDAYLTTLGHSLLFGPYREKKLAELRRRLITCEWVYVDNFKSGTAPQPKPKKDVAPVTNTMSLKYREVIETNKSIDLTPSTISDLLSFLIDGDDSPITLTIDNDFKTDKEADEAFMRALVMFFNKYGK